MTHNDDQASLDPDDQPFDINEDPVDDDSADHDSNEREGRGDPSGSPFNINENSVDDD